MKNSSLIKLAGVLTCLGSLSAPIHAQQAMPKAEDIDKPVMPSTADIKAAMEKAKGQVAAGKAEGLDRAAARAAASPVGAGKGPAGMPSTERMPDVSQLMKGGGVDPAKLAETYGAPSQSPFLGEDRVYKLVVFASLSMPEGSLTKLGRDVKKAGGVIVLRGMRYGISGNDWTRSVEAMKPLVATGADIELNPGLFQHFGIKSVPTIVVSPAGIADKGCTEGKCAAGAFATVMGDVSLDYALDTLTDRKDAVGKLARQLYEKVQ